MAPNPQFDTPTARWSALTVRDPESNNKFVYCVKTTRIYCRPICPSRRARRANVEFHNTPTQAEAAGYRACKRCKPEILNGEEAEVQKMRARIARAKQRVLSGEDVVLKDLAKEAGWSKWHFGRVFKKVVGLSPKELRDQIRAEARGKESMAGSMISPTIRANSSTHDGDREDFASPRLNESFPTLLSDLEPAYPDFDYEAFSYEVSSLTPALASLFPKEIIQLGGLDYDAMTNACFNNKETMTDFFDFNGPIYMDNLDYNGSITPLVDWTADSASSSGLQSLSTPTNGFVTLTDLENYVDTSVGV